MMRLILRLALVAEISTPAPAPLDGIGC